MLFALDGKGAESVASELTGAALELRLITAVPNGEDVLLEWANHSLTRRNAFSSVARQSVGRWASQPT